MARNGSGAMSIPNTLVSGATITAAGHNQNYSDIGSELTNSVALDGQSIMTGQFKAANGTVVAPGITFGADLDSGFYRIGADNIGFALGGALVVNYSATGVAITGTLSASGAGTIGGALTVTGAITATAGFAGTVTTTGSSASFVAYEGISTEAGAAAGPTCDLYRNSASPAVSDSMGAVNFYGKDSGGNKTLYGQVGCLIADTTDGSEDGDLFLFATVGGALTAVLNNNGTQIQIPGSLAVTGAVAGSNIKPPTVQRFTSSSGNYVAAAGTAYARVRMCAGGGGGGGATANNGSNGGDTSFGSWTAIHGNGGNGNVTTGAGGSGGTGGTDGTGTQIVRIPGGRGNAMTQCGASAQDAGGIGGTNPFGGAGAPAGNGAGGAGATNTGAGGAGGGSNNSNMGYGGGAGEYVEFYVSSPGTIAYSVGAGGNGGAAGTNAGGNGAAGIIIVEEFYV